MKTHPIQKPRLKLFAPALLTLAILAWIAPLSANAAPLGTAFTYQGLLTVSGSPANGSYDFNFNLFDANSGGSPVTAAVVSPGVVVANGLFTTTIGFGD